MYIMYIYIYMVLCNIESLTSDKKRSDEELRDLDAKNKITEDMVHTLYNVIVLSMHILLCFLLKLFPNKITMPVINTVNGSHLR